MTVKVLNFIRAISSEGYGRIRFFKIVREHLKTDPSFRKFFEGESTVLPEFYIHIIKRDMGYAWDWLPPGALHYDHKAYLKKSARKIKPVTEVSPS
jgi:hypothetical protein